MRRCPPTQSGSFLPVATLAHRQHQGMRMRPHGKRHRLVPIPNRARKGPKEEDTALSAATPQTEPPGTPKGLQ